MEKDWREGVDSEAHAQPFDGDRLERVVPAAGDPEAQYYWGTVPGGMPFQGQAVGGARRRGASRWLLVAALVVLELLLIKPLLVLAGVLFAVLATLLLVGLLVMGFLLFAARLALGGPLGYGTGRRFWLVGRRRLMRRGWGGLWYYD